MSKQLFWAAPSNFRGLSAGESQLEDRKRRYLLGNHTKNITHCAGILHFTQMELKNKSKYTIIKYRKVCPALNYCTLYVNLVKRNGHNDDKYFTGKLP